MQDRSISINDINGIIKNAGVQIKDRIIRNKLCENGLRVRIQGNPIIKPETEVHRLGFTT